MTANPNLFQTHEVTVEDFVRPELRNPKSRTFAELIASLETRSETLSFSSFKSFYKPQGNPRKFLAYKLNERKQTAAMKKGNILDVLLTQGREVAEQMFWVKVKPNLRTKAGKAEWEKIHQEATAANAEVVTQSDWDNAMYLHDRVMKNGAARWLLDQITDSQVPVSGELLGWNWRGYADFMGDDIVIDLKRKASAEPRKVYYQIRDANELLQLFLYDWLTGSKRDMYSLVIDESGDICPVRYTESDKARAYAQFESGILALEKCILKRDFTRSYDFWAPSRDGIFEYSQLR